MTQQPRLMRRVGLASIAAVAVFAGAISSSAIAAADESGKPGTLINAPDDPVNVWASQQDKQAMANQENLITLREWIRSQSGDPDGRYLDQVDNPAANSTTLLWAGSANDPFILAALNRAASMGIAATVQLRPFTLPQIQAAQAAVENARGSLQLLGFDLESISGVRDTGSDLYATGAVHAGASIDAIQSALQNLTNIPIHLVDGQAGIATRQADTSPFWAGAFMTDEYGTYCSSGFSMIYGGVIHTTTARHCIPQNNVSGQGWYANSGSGREGQIIYTADTGALSVLQGNGAAVAYDGPWNDSTGYAKSVYDYETPGIGDNVCTGGGNSGEHCGANIKETGVELYEDNTGKYVSTVRAQVSSGIAVIEGDSGGPVIIPITSGSASGEVHAVGMIQGEVNGHLSCGSVAVSTGALCSDQVLFSYISTVVNHSSLLLAVQ